MIITPAYATKTFEVTKEVGVKKDLFEKTLTDLTSYKKIFPNLIKDVKIDPSNKNQAKFIIEAAGTREADVKSTVKPDGSFVVDVISGDLKGSKITTTLQARPGFGDGAPNGATTVKCTLILETGFWASIVLAAFSDSDIKKGIGDGFWELGEHVKEKYPEKELVKVDLKEKSTKMPKLEAAKKLDLQKEAKKIQPKTTQTKSVKVESAKTLNFEKETKKPQSVKPKISTVQKESIPQTKAKPSLVMPSIFVSIPKSSYSEDQTVVISGYVTSIIENSPVTMQILAPNGDLVTVEQLSVGADGRYFTSLTAGGFLWKDEGIYTVIVLYGFEQITDRTSFEFKFAPKQNSFISLDPLPITARIGDVVIFSGKLHLLGTNSQGATVYIKDEDPFGGDDSMAAGIVDSTGRFYIQWTVQNMDVDSVADVYAVFEGSDIHPRLTTCGTDCSNTVQLTTLR